MAHGSSSRIAKSVVAAALLTKYQGPAMEKVGVLHKPNAESYLTSQQPVIRPYTPTSDEGRWFTTAIPLPIFAS